jgi:hypothetical protein
VVAFEHDRRWGQYDLKSGRGADYYFIVAISLVKLSPSLNFFSLGGWGRGTGDHGLL